MAKVVRIEHPYFIIDKLEQLMLRIADKYVKEFRDFYEITEKLIGDRYKVLLKIAIEKIFLPLAYFKYLTQNELKLTWFDIRFIILHKYTGAMKNPVDYIDRVLDPDTYFKMVENGLIDYLKYIIREIPPEYDGVETALLVNFPIYLVINMNEEEMSYEEIFLYAKNERKELFGSIGYNVSPEHLLCEFFYLYMRYYLRLVDYVRYMESEKEFIKKLAGKEKEEKKEEEWEEKSPFAEFGI